MRRARQRSALHLRGHALPELLQGRRRQALGLRRGPQEAAEQRARRRRRRALQGAHWGMMADDGGR